MHGHSVSYSLLCNKICSLMSTVHYFNKCTAVWWNCVQQLYIIDINKHCCIDKTNSCILLPLFD